MKVEPNIVLSVFITNMEDINHHEDTTNVDIPSKVATQAHSLENFQVPYYLLTNEPSQEKIENLSIVNVNLDRIYHNYSDLSVYFLRIFMAFKFLQDHPEIEKAAITDASDVTMLNYPFDRVKPDTLYMGDEPHSVALGVQTFIEDDPQYIYDYLLENSDLFLTLNPGVLVGTREILIEYLGIMVKLLSEAKLKFKQGDETYHLGPYDMSISNYVAYKYFSDRLIHGREVSTIFNGYQERSSAWFKHK